MSAHVATTLTMLAENQLTSSCCLHGNWICGWVWCVTAWLPSHINDLLGHYSDEDTSHIWRKMGIHMYINEYHTLFVTFLHWIMQKQNFCEALPSFCYVQISANMLADVLSIWQVTSFWMIQSTEFDHVLAQYSQHFTNMTVCLQPTCHFWGGQDLLT